MTSFQMDTREPQRLRDAVQKLIPDANSTALSIGDFWIKTDTAHLVIERKTFGDLYSSIVSGHFSDQRERMLALREKEGPRLILIIEGYSIGNIHLNIREKASKVVAGLLENLVLYHAIDILPTFNETHTSETLAHLYKKCQKPDPIASSSFRSPLASASSKNFLVNQLCLVKGVSPAIAKCIAEEYTNLPILISALQQDPLCLQNIRSGQSRRIGSVSKRIYTAFILNQ